MILKLCGFKCVKMEKQFISECIKWGFGDNAADHIILSKDIQERSLSLKNMGDKFPVAAAALMVCSSF